MKSSDGHPLDVKGIVYTLNMEVHTLSITVYIVSLEVPTFKLRVRTSPCWVYVLATHLKVGTTSGKGRPFTMKGSDGHPLDVEGMVCTLNMEVSTLSNEGRYCGHYKVYCQTRVCLSCLFRRRGPHLFPECGLADR